MAHIEGPKYPGPYVIDLTPLEAHLVNLAPNAMQGARGEQPNIDGVLEELDVHPKSSCEFGMSHMWHERQHVVVRV